MIILRRTYRHVCVCFGELACSAGPEACLVECVPHHQPSQGLAHAATLSKAPLQQENHL